jgi:hypothetical protein
MSACVGIKSGKYWIRWAEVHAKNSTRLEDLDPQFGALLRPFIAALRAAGATVEVTSTRRSPERAYLFHWSWKISQGWCNASQAATLPGIDIEWDHGSDAQSCAGALDMAEGFGLALPPQSILPPELGSEHIVGNAVDMDILWDGTITVRDHDGRQVELTFMHDANANLRLHAVGASYGVKKLANDGPHWSLSGR